MIRINDSFIEYESSGLFRTAGEWIHPERVIDTYVLIFVLKGTVRIIEDGVYYEIRENELILLEPGKCHRGYEITNEKISYYWIHFRTDKKIPAKYIASENPHSFKNMFSQLLHVTNTPGYSSNASEYICGMILEEFSFVSLQEQMIGNRLAAEIKEYIRLNINKNISINTVALHFGYHPNYIGTVFRNNYELSMKKYITDMKLKNAQDYLMTTLYTVKEIAYMTGFKSENHFIKFFKYHMKITPTEYRNIYVNIHINNK